MREVLLTFPTPEGSEEISIVEGRITFGRGSDADHRFHDAGLSRLHASVYRENDRIWIVDENSANGTFVNGTSVGPAGVPLENGDSISIGNETILKVWVKQAAAEAPSPSIGAPVRQQPTQTLSSGSPMSLVPILLIAFAILIVSVSGVIVAFKVFGWGNGETVQSRNDEEDLFELSDTKAKVTPTPKGNATTTSEVRPNGSDQLPVDSTSNSELPVPTSSPVVTVPSGKKYLDMSDTEKRTYVAERSMRMAQVIGNRSSDQIPPLAVDKIKSFVDAYAKRINVKPLGGCRFGDNLQVTYERASKNAPFIVRAFNEKAIDPRIGLYLAMIESEHCVCLQSPTGPLGMFQFTKSTGENHGLKTISGASPSNPDERCEPEPSARAAASYMKSLTGRYGTGPSSVPLAIGSYNSGEGGLSSNLVKALESGSGVERDFWTLISKGDILSKQFQSENFKYVPKFFAAAIVGENPQDYGLKLQPLSSYSR